MIKQVYIDIKNKIETDLSGTIKTVDLFNNQFKKESVNKSVNYPVLFIEFSSMDYVSELYGVQKCNVELTFHIGFHHLTDTTTIFDITQKVFQKFNGFSTENIASFERIRERQDIDHDNVMIWEQIYSATITDDDANDTDGKIETQLTKIQITAI